MPSVVVPNEFFVRERRMYANWQFAFWRELFQNSTDAGCSNIRISLVDKGNKIIGIEFEDNGVGMTREVLDTVYFKLGASTKNDGSTVGGFGRARILTCFSMKSYTIHTQNNLVQGEGGSYEIAEVDYRKGCLIQVEIENENIETLQRALEEYLSYSQLDCIVTINDKRWTQWSYRRQLTRTLNVGDVIFAHVHVNKTAANNRLLIRVNGTVMYHQYIQAKAQVIVEVVSNLAREVLTANRDGMHSKYASVLNSFIQELNVDTNSALESKLKRKNSKIRGRGLIFSINPSKPITKKLVRPNVDIKGAPIFVQAGVGQNTVSLQSDSNFVSDVKIAEIVGVDESNSDNILNKTGFVRPTIIPVLGEKFATDLHDIFIIDDTDNENIRRVIDQYNPEKWVVCETGGKLYNKGGNLYKLLVLWRVACQAAIDCLMAVRSNIHEVGWTLGWIFSDTNEASCKPIEGGHCLLLNPVDKDGKMAYSLNNKVDLKKLMAFAKHEVSHIVCSFHDESFASVMTEIDAKYDEKEIFRKMKEALAE